MNQEWYLASGAVIKQTATNRALLVISAPGVRIHGSGILDCSAATTDPVTGTGHPGVVIILDNISNPPVPDGIRLENFTIQSAPTANGPGLQAGDASDLHIDGIKVKNCAGDAILVAAFNNLPTGMHDVEVVNCFIDKSSVDTAITKNQGGISLFTRYTSALASSLTTITRARVEANTILMKAGNAGLSFGTSSYCINTTTFPFGSTGLASPTPGVDHVVLSGNICEGSWNSIGLFSSHTVVTGNSCKDFVAGILVSGGCQEVAISANALDGTGSASVPGSSAGLGYYGVTIEPSGATGSSTNYPLNVGINNNTIVNVFFGVRDDAGAQRVNVSDNTLVITGQSTSSAAGPHGVVSNNGGGNWIIDANIIDGSAVVLGSGNLDDSAVYIKSGTVNSATDYRVTNNKTTGFSHNVALYSDVNGKTTDSILIQGNTFAPSGQGDLPSGVFVITGSGSKLGPNVVVQLNSGISLAKQVTSGSGAGLVPVPLDSLPGGAMVPVAFATTGPLPASPAYANGPNSDGVGATLTATGGPIFSALQIDGSPVAVAQRLLIKDEALAAHHGVYVVTDPGSPFCQHDLRHLR